MNFRGPHFILIFILCSFTSKSEFKNTNYIKEIPFNFDYGVPIIKASINGIEYNFLFDTGMPTVLSESITKQLDLKSIRSVVGVDVNGNRKEERYVMVNEISIEGISFKNIETLSTDLKAGFEIGCLNLDGVIGNNLIKDAVWEIDYEKKMIHLTDKIENFNIPQNADIIKFKTNSKKGYYSPSIDIAVNGKKRKGVKFDTGSSGFINLPLAFFASALDPNKSIEYYGQATAALYGKGNNKKYVDSKVKTIKLGSLEIDNQIVTFDENFPIIGNQFFKYFRIIISYNEQKIYMIKQKEYINDRLENFGFQTAIINHKAISSIIYKNSNAEKEGLQLGDEILTVNNLNFPALISKDACDVLFNNPLKKLDSINIIFSRNGIEKSLQLKKQVFID